MPSLQLASRTVLLILITSICLGGNFLFSQSTGEIAKALSSIDPTVAKDKFQEVFKNQDWEDVRNQINANIIETKIVTISNELCTLSKRVTLTDM